MRFQNEDASLELTVSAYEFPAGEAPDSDDENWLVLRCAWTDGEGILRKDSNSCLLTQELQALAAGLKVLQAGIKPGYESEFSEPWFAVSAQAAEAETFRFFVRFVLPNTMDGDDTAELDCILTREELKVLIEELDGLCRRFPDRR